jgi:hypothetical protein
LGKRPPGATINWFGVLVDSSDPAGDTNARGFQFHPFDRLIAQTNHEGFGVDAGGGGGSGVYFADPVGRYPLSSPFGLKMILDGTDGSITHQIGTGSGYTTLTLVTDSNASGGIPTAADLTLVSSFTPGDDFVVMVLGNACCGAANMDLDRVTVTGTTVPPGPNSTEDLWIYY